jgi:hypothetical protein
MDGLYDPPRLMVSDATLDVPSATTTPNAEPQQGASTAHTTPMPTAASDMLPNNSQESVASYLAATERSAHHDAEDPTSATVATESQTPNFSADTQLDVPTNAAGSSTRNDAGTSTSATAAIPSQTPDFSADAQSDNPFSAAGSPTTNGVDTSTSHTALMKSQTPDLVPGSQSRALSTTVSSPLANEASTGTQSDDASAASTGTSVGVSSASTAKNYVVVGLLLFFSFVY